MLQMGKILLGQQKITALQFSFPFSHLMVYTDTHRG
jgi:hypothetical protein